MKTPNTLDFSQVKVGDELPPLFIDVTATVVVAGAIATRIRELAHENRVPLVEDVPLARTLYKVCEVDSEIPREFYTAVARVLAFVMSLKRRGAATGFHSNAELALSGRR
jgi:flagellar biosynthesis protein FlhB